MATGSAIMFIFPKTDRMLTSRDASSRSSNQMSPVAPGAVGGVDVPPHQEEQNKLQLCFSTQFVSDPHPVSTCDAALHLLLQGAASVQTRKLQLCSSFLWLLNKTRFKRTGCFNNVALRSTSPEDRKTHWEIKWRKRRVFGLKWIDSTVQSCIRPVTRRAEVSS